MKIKKIVVGKSGRMMKKLTRQKNKNCLLPVKEKREKKIQKEDGDENERKKKTTTMRRRKRRRNHYTGTGTDNYIINISTLYTTNYLLTSYLNFFVVVVFEMMNVATLFLFCSGSLNRID